jgi:hypothetical protein
MGNVLVGLLFVAFVIGILFSLVLFNRGDTGRERVAKLLPSDFRPDFSHRKGDTYVGFEKVNNRLVLVDWPHAKVLTPRDVLSLEPVHDSMLGITHHWLAIDVPDTDFPRYRIWFQFRGAKLDEWHRRLAEICKK